MLEDALEEYPATRLLEGGLVCTVRPQEGADEDAFVSFLKSVPEIDRLYIKQRLGSARFRKRWCRDLDFDSALTMLAIAHDHVVGLVTLQHRQGGWKRHIGRVHCLTHPEYRDVGVSRLMVEEIISISRHCGLLRLEAEFNGERSATIRCLREAGFQEMLRMPRYLRDMSGGVHDWILMGMQLRPDAELTMAGD